MALEPTRKASGQLLSESWRESRLNANSRSAGLFPFLALGGKQGF